MPIMGIFVARCTCLTMYNASSSPLTLTIGLIIVAIGFPFVLAYTGVIYWTFRGKVELGENSY